MSLKDLPVSPSLTGSLVQDAYIAELKAVAAPHQLEAFTMRWLPLYLMTRKPEMKKGQKGAKLVRINENNMHKVVNGTYDSKEALECVLASRAGICKHAQQYCCPGAHIVLPTILLQATFVANKFGVGADLALIQMNGGLEALDGHTED